MLFAIATTVDVGIFYIIVLAATAFVPTTAFAISIWTIYIRARVAVVAIRNTFIILIIIRTLFVTITIVIVIIVMVIIVRIWII